LKSFTGNLVDKGGVAMEKKKQLSNEEQNKLLEELEFAVYELVADEFTYLYRALEKLQRRLDALDEAFGRFCDEHNISCY
jgi:uncharacterized protein with von Willebrand factor type A (vWA) domain